MKKLIVIPLLMLTIFSGSATAQTLCDGKVVIGMKTAASFPQLGLHDIPAKVDTGAFTSSLYDADRNKGTAFIRSIETGNYLNDTFSGVESTLSAIMGREAAMSGEKVRWDHLRQSSHRLDPKLNLSQFDPV